MESNLSHLAMMLNVGHDAVILQRRAKRHGITRFGMSLHRVTPWGVAGTWGIEESIGAGDTTPMDVQG